MGTKQLPMTNEQEYAAAQAGSVMIDAAAWGRLRFTGKDRLDFLHRMSTNDLLKLRAGQGAATVFTTPIARIIDRTMIYVRETDLLMLTSRGNQGRVLQWLRKYIFFNDEVQIKNVTDETAMLSIYGTTVDHVMHWASGEDLTTLPLHHWRTVRIAQIEALIARADPIGGGGFHVIVEKAMLPQVWQALLAIGVVPIGEETYQVLRIEAGLPEFGHELGDEYIPLEANLWADVSFSKGCYTGQEIIARLESRQRLAKQLMGLRFEAEVTLPVTLFSDEHEVGVVTSAAHSPRLGWIGLGYLKSAKATVGQPLQARSAERAMPATVSALPFH
jgi:tRNA-modifying protein YgfZ